MKDHTVDHLFRHEYGKMVSSLTRLYGLHNLQLIEDAVQDTFHKALVYFKSKPPPENLSAYLHKAVKNRAVDLFRKANTMKKYEATTGPTFMSMSETFSKHEIEDSQLRMLFTSCHPALNPKEQIIFALKLLSGFSILEIASSLLVDSENIKKTLQRARKKIAQQHISFSVPTGKELEKRLDAVHLAIYLLFNEGFHSSHKTHLIRKDLIAEALRLNDLLIQKFNHPETSALMALMCFLAARADAKVDENGNLIQLHNQKRERWNRMLIWKGNVHMENAVSSDVYSRYHYEAAIAGEFVSASNFTDIDWGRLELYYTELLKLQPSVTNYLDKAVVHCQQKNFAKALATIGKINENDVKTKAHLYFSILAEISIEKQDFIAALKYLQKASKSAKNLAEKTLIAKKIEIVEDKFTN